MKRNLFTLIACCFLLSCLGTQALWADKPKKVHGKAKLIISMNDNVTPMEAKRDCINRARYEAIKAEFGEVVSSTTNMVDANVDGEDISQFVSETSMSAKAEWVEDTKEPVVKMEVIDDQIIYNAEVWGLAREIPYNTIDFEWKVLAGGKEDYRESDQFNNKQRIYIKFKSPVDGYLAIYVLDSTTKRANCLLPYKHNATGQHYVRGGVEYCLFDPETDPKAIIYKMVTSEPIEMDNIVLLFSPNPFTKCNENSGDRLHPNTLHVDDFNNWVRRLQNRDEKMVVDRSRWLKISRNDMKNNF